MSILNLNIRKIAIGLDNTTPTGADFKLLNKYRETTALTPRIVTETNDYIIVDISGNFSFTEDKTIYEFGAFDYNNVLLARDVVPEGVSVTNGQVLTITYRFIIGTYP
jgi:hypothetical protein